MEIGLLQRRRLGFPQTNRHRGKSQDSQLPSSTKRGTRRHTKHQKVFPELRRFGYIRQSLRLERGLLVKLGGWTLGSRTNQSTPSNPTVPTKTHLSPKVGGAGGPLRQIEVLFLGNYPNGQATGHWRTAMLETGSCLRDRAA